MSLWKSCSFWKGGKFLLHWIEGYEGYTECMFLIVPVSFCYWLAGCFDTRRKSISMGGVSPTYLSRGLSRNKQL